MELKGKNAFQSQFTYKLQRDLETWLTLSIKQTQVILRRRNSREKLSKTINLIIFLLFSWKFCPRIVGKLTSFAFLVYV